MPSTTNAGSRPALLSAAASTLLHYRRTKSWSDIALLAKRFLAIRREARAIVENVDHDKFEELQKRYEGKTKATYPWVRYLELELHFRREVFRAFKLKLDRTSARRVLDLGTGPGYFPLVCRHYGHDCIGVDIEQPLFGRIAKIIQVDRRILR